MTRQIQASAYPRKSFFLDMFTRDISLEDAILDMIDNSIDGLARTDAPEMFKRIGAMDLPDGPARHRIDVRLSTKRIMVRDNCGGVPFETARTDVFNFGHAPDFQPKEQIGVYGVGLKRAAFKMGHRFRMVSRTGKDGFSVDWDIKEWGKKDGELSDWEIPIRRVGGVRTSALRGTTIVVERLRPEVVAVLDGPEFVERLREKIATTYTWFLNKYVTVRLNGLVVEPFRIPFGRSAALKPAFETARYGGVEVTMWAGLYAKGIKGQEERLAGWYVMCNGRVVVAADKSDLTGWGVGTAQQWHDKYRGFVGLVFITAENPLSLPWTTTKRGLHRESPAYLATLNGMRSLARPVLQFLSRQYTQDPEPSTFARKLADEIRPTDVLSLPRESSAFEAPLPPRRAEREMVSVSLRISMSRIRLAAKHLGDPELSARQVVMKAFDAFLEMRGL